MSAAHTPRNFREPRRSVVEPARQAWMRRLIDLPRRNNLSYYRPLKTGTLDLSLADGDRMAALLSGETVPRLAQSISSARRKRVAAVGGVCRELLETRMATVPRHKEHGVATTPALKGPKVNSRG